MAEQSKKLRRQKTPAQRRKTLVVKTDWAGFRKRMFSYAKLESRRRSDLLFRGQGDATWPLQTTLDRRCELDSDDQREGLIRRLLDEFKSQLIGLAEGNRDIPEGEALELARHHGLPSPLLDFTQSPWIAAFFAFDDVDSKAKRVSVWRLDRARVASFGEDTA